MKMRRFGDSEIAPLALGGNVFGWTVDEAMAFRILDRFVASGLSLIDTANSYSRWVPGNRGGESETIIGNWLRQRGGRHRVLIATKVGSEMGPGEKGLSKSYIRSEAEGSLRRLGTDYIDLYQSHRDDPDTPLDETLETYDRLISQGKVRMIGASNFTPGRLLESLQVSKEHGYPAYRCLQPHYNLYDRAEYEKDLDAICRGNALAVIPYYSLASGFLTGKYRSENDLAQSPRGAGVKKYLNDRGFRILRALDDVATRASATPAGVALAWLMAQPGITAPIASATSPEQLDALIGATRIALDESSLELLNRASSW